MRHSRSNKKSNDLIYEELEPRLLLSADLFGIAIDSASNESDQRVDEVELQTIEATLLSDPLSLPDESNTSTQELVIIDTATPDYLSLMDDIITHSGEGHHFEIMLLDSAENGIDQLSEILMNYQGLDAIHLISHGSPGEIRLGDATLDMNELQQSADRIAAWGQALNSGGDWLIYGCNIGSSTSGERFVEKFATLTGADVAASDDITGHSAAGGDWQFEYQVGSVETTIVFSTPLQNGWGGTLDITSGLVGHYTFDEGSGTTAIDSSLTGNHGTLFGGPTYTTGQVGSNALSFNGNLDRVEAPDNATTDFGSGDFSVGFWFNSTYSGPQARLLGDAADGGGDGYIFFTNGTNDLNLEVSSGPSAILLTADGLFDGNWHHIIGTRSGADFTLYVDGHEADNWTGSTLGDIDNSQPLRIGASSTFGDYDGLIDEIRIYDRAMTADDAIELFTDGGGVVSYPTSYGLDNSLEWITNVSFSGIDNTTARESGGYGDYTGQTAIIDRGTSSTLSVTIDPEFNNYVNAWVDWNQDNDFNDPGESYVLATNTSSSGPHSLSIAAPVDAVTGTTVMRVSLQYLFSPSPGETMNYGEVEDYSVNVTGNADPVITSNSGGATANVNVNENTTAVTTVTATDINHDNLTYSINPASTDAHIFNINSTSGELTFVTAPDYENFTDANGDNVYEVTVRVDDDNSGIDEQTIYVTVNNVNEAPVDIIAPDSLQVNMGSGEGDYASVANFADFLSTALTYEISFASSNLGHTALASYAVPSNDNEFELYVDSDVLLVVIDDVTNWTTISNTTLFDGERHQLSVSWENTTGELNIYVDGVLEYTANSFNIGTSIESGGTFMLGQEQDAVGGDFDAYQRFLGDIYDVRIYNDVRTAQEIADNANSPLVDPSADPNLVANWQMTDNGSGGIADLAGNHDLTLFADAAFGPIAVREDAANGTAVGFLSTLDPDLGDTHTYSLLDNAGGAFSIDTNTGLVSVADGSLIDYETALSMDITVRTTDAGGLTSDQVISITILNVNEYTPVANSDTVTVAEGGTATTLVGGSATVLNNDTGLSDTPTTVSLVTDVTNGSLILNGDGTFSYTHNGSENFTDSFTYRVTDNDWHRRFHHRCRSPDR